MEQLHILDTIQVVASLIPLEATEFIPEVGCVTQSIWTNEEIRQIKGQLKGLLSLIPAADQFHKPSEE